MVEADHRVVNGIVSLLLVQFVNGGVHNFLSTYITLAEVSEG